MKRTWIILAAGAALVGAVAGALWWSAQSRPEPVVIAAIVPTSGLTADAHSVARGLQLAARNLNRSGGIAGRPIELLIRDNRGDVQTARLLFGELEQERRPLVYFSVTSAVGRGLAPIAENSDAPLIALVATDPLVSEGREWVFRFFPSAEEEAATLLRLAESHGAERLAIAYVNDPFGRSIHSALQARIPTDIPLEPVAFARDENDFEQHVRQLIDTPAIVLAGFPRQIVELSRTLTELGYEGERYATSEASLPSVRRDPATRGLFAAAPTLYNDNYVFAADVRLQYSERYNEDFSHYAANGVDALNIVAGLLREGPVTRRRLRDRLDRGFIYPGVVGEIVVGAGNHGFGFELQPAQIGERGTIRFVP